MAPGGARPPEDMIRFVLAPDGTATPDLKRRLPGRGVWTTASAEVVAQAIKRRAFDRGFRGKAVVPDDLPDRIDRLMEADCLQRLSLANKAGLVITGFAKVEAAIAAGEAIAILHATDGGQDGKRKIGQALRRRFGGEAPPELECFGSAQLDLALGRTNVIHAALRAGPASAALLASMKRLLVYRSAATPSAQAGSAAEMG
ncbi:MAG TPA: RNA-binding protein [Rhodoblastus sp.]|nr:RNA-binding protein [Rhodoblastus sp.]